MNSKVIACYSDNNFILRLSEDTFTDAPNLFNVSLEADLAIMAEANFKDLDKAQKLYNSLENNLKMLS